MSTLSTLKKAVEKAKSNGYEIPFDLVYETGRVIDGKTYYAIIFDKEFCKAIWGSEERFLPFNSTHPQIGYVTTLWVWHVKNMVESDDKIKYLEENLDLDSWDKIIK